MDFLQEKYYQYDRSNPHITNRQGDTLDLSLQYLHGRSLASPSLLFRFLLSCCAGLRGLVTLPCIRPAVRVSETGNMCAYRPGKARTIQATLTTWTMRVDVSVTCKLARSFLSGPPAFRLELKPVITQACHTFREATVPDILQLSLPSLNFFFFLPGVGQLATLMPSARPTYRLCSGAADLCSLPPSFRVASPALTLSPGHSLSLSRSISLPLSPFFCH